MKSVIGVQISETNYQEAASMILGWSKNYESHYVCVANVHMIMEAYDYPAFKKIVNHAALVTPDGMPLVWLMRIKGEKQQQRVYGPTLMLHVLESAGRENIPVGFYGGSPQTLSLLVEKLQTEYKNLKIAYSFSPPFRELTLDENKEILDVIKKSGARILFVGLGCPKQEIWMAINREHLNLVMMGVGAAFDFHAGTKPQAPDWMQRIGLEWLFRFLTEPRRLWKRYLYHNPRFILLSIADVFGLLNKI